MKRPKEGRKGLFSNLIREREREGERRNRTEKEDRGWRRTDAWKEEKKEEVRTGV